MPILLVHVKYFNQQRLDLLRVSFLKKILKSVQIKFCNVSFKELQERGQEYLSMFTDALRMM